MLNNAVLNLDIVGVDFISDILNSTQQYDISSDASLRTSYGNKMSVKCQFPTNSVVS